MNLKDVQNEKDYREIPIDRVGVKNLEYPIVVEDRKNQFQNTVAAVNMAVSLPHHFRGTHMSRFIEILNKYRGYLSEESIFSILQDMEENLEAEKSFFEAVFPYFIERKAPVSQAKSLMNYKGIFIGTKEINQAAEFILGVQVPVTTLCPCSKEISMNSAHNQRSIVSVKIRYKEMVWLEDLIDIVEKSSSCEIYPLLKREDEKYVTEKAYENPNFAEDIVRNIGMILKKDKNILSFQIETEHFESIHNHNVFAEINVNK